MTPPVVLSSQGAASANEGHTASGRLAHSLDAALLDALVAAPAVHAHAPQLHGALRQTLAARPPVEGGRGRAPNGTAGVFGVQAFTSDGRTSRTAVRPAVCGAVWGLCYPLLAAACRALFGS